MPLTEKANIGLRHSRKGKGRPIGSGAKKMRDLVEKKVDTTELVDDRDDNIADEDIFDSQIESPNIDMNAFEELVNKKLKLFEDSIEQKRTARLLEKEEKKKQKAEEATARLLEKQKIKEQKLLEKQKADEEFKSRLLQHVDEKITGKKRDDLVNVISHTVRNRRNRFS